MSTQQEKRRQSYIDIITTLGGTVKGNTTTEIAYQAFQDELTAAGKSPKGLAYSELFHAWLGHRLADAPQSTSTADRAIEYAKVLDPNHANWDSVGEIPAPAGGFLLDEYPGAAGGFSLRRLRGAATNAIRVRRTSDSLEQNFTPEEITDGTLTTFCAATDGVVTTMYNQVPTPTDDLKIASATQQPRIVNNGVLEKRNGLPSLEFDGTDDTLNATALGTSVQPNTFFVVFAIKTGGTLDQFIFDGTNSSGRSNMFMNGTTGVLFGGTTVRLNTAEAILRDTLLQSSLLCNSTSGVLRLNGVEEATGNTGTGSIIGLQISNAQGFVRPINGAINEIIVYHDDQSANFAGIDGNQKTGWGIV